MYEQIKDLRSGKCDKAALDLRKEIKKNDGGNIVLIDTWEKKIYVHSKALFAALSFHGEFFKMFIKIHIDDHPDYEVVIDDEFFEEHINEVA